MEEKGLQDDPRYSQLLAMRNKTSSNLGPGGQDPNAQHKPMPMVSPK